MNEALENISRAVIREAEEEASRIIGEAESRLAARLEEVRQAEEENASRRLGEEKERLKEEHRRRVAHAQRRRRLKKLELRNQVIEEIFTCLRHEIGKQSEAGYKTVLRSWLEAIDEKGGALLVPGERDAALCEELLGEVNKKRPAAVRLRLSPQQAPFERGFIFRGEGYEITRSLSGWLEEEKKRLAPELERELFGAGDGEEG